MTPTIGELQASVIEATQDPLAHIKVQKAADALDHLGRTLGGSGLVAYKDVEAITDVMLGGWTKDTLEEISSTTAFVLALSGMLKIALEHWVADNHKRMLEKAATKKPQ